MNKMLAFHLMLSCLLFHSSSHGLQAPDLTLEEIESMLGTNNVRDYEVVSTAYATHGDNSDSPVRLLQITSLKRDIRLYLEPADGLLAGKRTPVWMVNEDWLSPLGLKYTKIPNAMDDMVQIYQDTRNSAAIAIRYKKDGGVYFEGTIGNNLILRQLPSGLREKLPRHKRAASFPAGNRAAYREDLRRADHHVLVEVAEPPINGTREKSGSYVPRANSSRSRREAFKVPATIYPQILVVVDYDIYSAFGSFIEFKQYILSFWNAVDLRYRVFVDPNVRINIAGIVISTDPRATPYLHKSRYRSSNGIVVIDADKALDRAGRYFYDEATHRRAKRLVLVDNYDAIMIMTRADLCNRVFEGHSYRYDCTTLGYSFRGGACTINVNESLMEAAGLVEDNAGYAGIVAAAHELGHLFGAPHDGRREPNRTTCSPDGGYIMSRVLTFSKNVFSWSYCSAKHLMDFFSSPRAECLFNRPDVDSKVTRSLPGSIMSLDEQCDHAKSSHACNRDSSVCTHLDCFDYKTGACVTIAPAAEGSDCGVGLYCINGKCINKTTSEIFLKIASPPS